MIKPQDLPAKTDEEINKSRPEDTNFDRDGHERHPTEQEQQEMRDEGHPKRKESDKAAGR